MLSSWGLGQNAINLTGIARSEDCQKLPTNLNTECQIGMLTQVDFYLRFFRLFFLPSVSVGVTQAMAALTSILCLPTAPCSANVPGKQILTGQATPVLKCMACCKNFRRRYSTKQHKRHGFISTSANGAFSEESLYSYSNVGLRLVLPEGCNL